MSIDLHITTDSHVCRSEELHVVVNILVLSAFKEFAFNNAGVLLGRFKDRYGIVGQVERQDEASIQILRDASVESGCESEHLLVVVYILEEVTFRLIRQEFVDVSEGVNFVSKSVVGRDKERLWLTRLGVFNTTNVEELVVLFFIELACEFIHSCYSEHSTKSINSSLGFNLITSKVVVTNEVLTWLIDCEVLGQLLSLQEE